MEAGLGGDFKFTQYALVGIHLFQAQHDLLGLWLNRDGRGKQLVTRPRRTRQLVRHQIIHPAQLGIHFAAQLGLAGIAVQPRAQHCQRCLQAVRQVGQGIALPFQIFALAVDEGIDAVGKRFQFTRMRFAHACGTTCLHPFELADHITQWPQAPTQHPHLQQQQHHAGTAQIAP